MLFQRKCTTLCKNFGRNRRLIYERKIQMPLFDKIRYGIARLFTRKLCAIKGSAIDKTARIGNGAQIVNCKIGRYSYIYGTSAVNTEIGAFCSIASGSHIGSGSHPTDWVSSSPVFYKGRNVLKTNFSQNEYKEYNKTTVGNDVWIGANCNIKGGVTIGDGAIIGMGSVVTKDVPPYEIWAGNPARLIRKRFDDETIEKLLKLEWWNLPDEKLKEIGDFFNDPKKLIEHFEENDK